MFEVIVSTFFWLIGEAFWELALPYLVIFGLFLGGIRFCVPTWHIRTKMMRAIKAFAWGLDRGMGNNNRRAVLFLALIIPISYWGWSQPLGPPILFSKDGQIPAIRKELPATSALVDETQEEVRSQLRKSWHNIQKLFLGDQEADRRLQERDAQARKNADALEGRREQVLTEERHTNWRRYWVGRIGQFVWMAFALVYGVIAPREEIETFLNRFLAGRRANGGSRGSGTPQSGSRSWGERFESAANYMLHFYNMLPERHGRGGPR